jgi:hypothetical protein
VLQAASTDRGRPGFDRFRTETATRESAIRLQAAFCSSNRSRRELLRGPLAE